MKELDQWDKTMAQAEEIFLEFVQMVKVYGVPRDSVDTGNDLKTIKDLLLELQVEFKDAKTSVLHEHEDKERGLYSLSKTNGEVLKFLYSLGIQAKTW